MEFKKPHFRIEDLKLDDLNLNTNLKLRGPIEPERLQSIYTQAFIYDLLYKFAKEHLPHIDDLNENIQPLNEKSTDTTVDTIKNKVIQYLLNLKDEDNKEDKIDENLPNTNNIWNTDDINILRKHFKSIKEENYSLKSKLFVIQDENIKLKDELNSIKIESKKLTGEKLSLEQSNERLYIRLQDLEKFYSKHLKETEIKEKEAKDLLEQISKLNHLNSELLAQKSKLEFELDKREYKLSSLGSELETNYNNQIEKHKLKYQKEIKLARERMYELAEKYKQKKSEFVKLEKSLDHLRSHFMTNASDRHKLNESLIQK